MARQGPAMIVFEAHVAPTIRGMLMSDFDDKPITLPEEDILGFNPLAKVIADSISKMEEPEGTVIAVNGPWGSGKSSVVNLVRHHLRSTGNPGLEVVDFKCWWFRGEEALTVAFFHELYSAFSPSFDRRAKKALSKLGKFLSIAGATLSAVGVFNALLAGVGKAASAIGKLFGRQEETVEMLHKEIFHALRKGSSRYLIIIDDIDRLSPDEAILIFRLVKSVGGLPNVMYLLAYDRQLAEKTVAERYPSEGPHYLEKIVQASFDLPAPSQTSLNREFARRLNTVIRIEGFQEETRFQNLYNELIEPEIKTPRDFIRILNPLKVTWAAVREEVNPADFLCLETLRIQRPELYRTLKANKDRVTGRQGTNLWGTSSSPERSEKYDAIFLECEPESDRERLRNGLMRLFPALKRAWKDVTHGEHSLALWDKQRRVCSPEHFDTYFQFSLSEDVLSTGEIKTLVASAGDAERLRDLFLDAANTRLASGSTKAQLFLEALRVHADDVPEDHVCDLLKSIYSVADNLVLAESKEGFQSTIFGETLPRLCGLIRQLTMERFTLERRSSVIREACNDATITCLAFIAGSAWGEHLPTENEIPKGPEERLTSQRHAEELKDLALKRIRKAANDGSLIECPLLMVVLLRWKGAEDGDEAVRTWVSTVIHSDAVAVVRIAEAFTGFGSGGYLGDSVPEQNYIALTSQLELVADLQEFRARAEQVLREGSLEAKDREILERFLNARENK